MYCMSLVNDEAVYYLENDIELIDEAGGGETERDRGVMSYDIRGDVDPLPFGQTVKH